VAREQASRKLLTFGVHTIESGRFLTGVGDAYVRNVLLLGGVLALTGCVTYPEPRLQPKMTWYKPNSTDAELAQDRSRCKQEAQQQASSKSVGEYHGSTDNYSATTNWISFDPCMKARGWAWVPIGQAQPAKYVDPIECGIDISPLEMPQAVIGSTVNGKTLPHKYCCPENSVNDHGYCVKKYAP
jgi:hypothetical protein